MPRFSFRCSNVKVKPCCFRVCRICLSLGLGARNFCVAVNDLAKQRSVAVFISKNDCGGRQKERGGPPRFLHAGETLIIIIITSAHIALFYSKRFTILSNITRDPTLLRWSTRPIMRKSEIQIRPWRLGLDLQTTQWTSVGRANTAQPSTATIIKAHHQNCFPNEKEIYDCFR